MSGMSPGAVPTMCPSPSPLLLDDLLDRVRPVHYIVIGQEGERRRRPRPVAGLTLVLNNRRDVFGEVDIGGTIKKEALVSTQLVSQRLQALGIPHACRGVS